MEQEITDIIKVINQGLESMPAIDTEAWDILVNGARANAIINIIIGITVMIVVGLVIKWMFKYWVTNFDADDFILFATGVLLLIAVFTFFFIAGNARVAISPEYYIVKELINVIR